MGFLPLAPENSHSDGGRAHIFVAAMGESNHNFARYHGHVRAFLLPSATVATVLLRRSFSKLRALPVEATNALAVIGPMPGIFFPACGSVRWCDASSGSAAPILQPGDRVPSDDRSCAAPAHGMYQVKHRLHPPGFLAEQSVHEGADLPPEKVGVPVHLSR